MKNSRIAWIDISKGLAMILVVVGHTISSYQEAGLYNDNALYNFLYQFIYSFHMPLFIMLSGMLVKKVSRENRVRKCVKLLLGYGIPYVIFTVMWVTLKIFLSRYVNNALSLDSLVRMFIYPVSFMWFIYTLLIMQLISVFFTAEKRNMKALHLILAGGGVLYKTYFGKMSF